MIDKDRTCWNQLIPTISPRCIVTFIYF